MKLKDKFRQEARLLAVSHLVNESIFEKEKVDWNPYYFVGDDILLLSVLKKWAHKNPSNHHGLFWIVLSEMLRLRDPYYNGVKNQNELYYMLEYSTGDFTTAFKISHEFQEKVNFILTNGDLEMIKDRIKETENEE